MDSQWLFPLSALLITPSKESSDIPLETELRERAKGVEFIFRLSAQLVLSNAVLGAAAQYFHRFYMRNSLEHYPRQEVAAASVFLATKTEECSRKLRDVSYVCYSKATGGKDESSPEVQRWQKTILATEEVLLDALCFDFIVDHAQAELVDLLVAFQAHETLEQYAWTIVNDSLRTPLCILQPPRVIATSCFILAQRIEEGPESASLDERIFSRASASLPTPPHMHARSPRYVNFAQGFFQLSDSEMEAIATTVTIMLEFYGTLDMQDSKDFHLRSLADLVPPTTSPSYHGLYRPEPNVNIIQPHPDGHTNGMTASPNDGGITPASMGRTPHQTRWSPVPDRPSSPCAENGGTTPTTPPGEPLTGEKTGESRAPPRTLPLDLS